MLVVLPVCGSDVRLAGFNLELLQLLEPSLPLPLDCLVTTDDGFDPSEIVVQAKKVFRTVKVYRYGKSWNGVPPPWPWPQNWAWQQSAKQIERTLGAVPRKKGNVRHWFWWEADCVPVRRGAFAEVAAASCASTKPFAGYIERHSGLQYMAGPGLYPMLISQYVQSALMVRKYAFDIVAGQEDGLVVSGKTADLSALIHHHRRDDNSGDHFSSADDVTRLIPPTSCFHHRCDDGSLHWVLSNGRVGPRPVKACKFVHVVERHETSEPRYRRAEDSWNELYLSGNFFGAHVRKWNRGSKVIGDSRDLPPLKEVLRFGLDMTDKGGILVFTNGDTILHPDLPALLQKVLEKQGVVCSFRLNFQPGADLRHSPAMLASLYKPDYGRDMFAFRREWLEEHWDDIPDFYLGELEWDLVMTVMIRQSLGLAVKSTSCFHERCESELPLGYVLHEVHDRKWLDPQFSEAPAKRWNKAQSCAWYKRHGLSSLFSMGECTFP